MYRKTDRRDSKETVNTLKKLLKCIKKINFQWGSVFESKDIMVDINTANYLWNEHSIIQKKNLYGPKSTFIC